MTSPRKLIVELHNILELFRSIFEDDKSILNSIDDSYEEVLITQLRLVPEQFDDLILQYINIAKALGNNINFTNLGKKLDELNDQGQLPVFNISSLDMIKTGCNALSMVKKDKMRVLNILIKLGPIFKCVDKLCTMPINIIKRIGVMQSEMNKYDNLI